MLSDPLVMFPACFHPIQDGDNSPYSAPTPMSTFVTTGFQNSTVTRERIGWRSEMGESPSVTPTHYPVLVVTSQQSVGKGDARRGRSLLRFEFPRKTAQGYSTSQFNKLYCVLDAYDGDQSDGISSAVEHLTYALCGIRPNATDIATPGALTGVGNGSWPDRDSGGIINSFDAGTDGSLISWRMFITREF